MVVAQSIAAPPSMIPTSSLDVMVVRAFSKKKKTSTKKKKIPKNIRKMIYKENEKIEEFGGSFEVFQALWDEGHGLFACNVMADTNVTMREIRSYGWRIPPGIDPRTGELIEEISREDRIKLRKKIDDFGLTLPEALEDIKEEKKRKKKEALRRLREAEKAWEAANDEDDDEGDAVQQEDKNDEGDAVQQEDKNDNGNAVQQDLENDNGNALQQEDENDNGNAVQQELENDKGNAVQQEDENGKGK